MINTITEQLTKETIQKTIEDSVNSLLNEIDTYIQLYSSLDKKEKAEINKYATGIRAKAKLEKTKVNKI